MLAMFVSRAELPGMAERRDKTLMKYLLDPTHFVQLIRCLLCPQVTSEEYKSKSSMVPYLATALFISPPNNDFIRELVKNREYLDAFFDLFTKYDDQVCAFLFAFATHILKNISFVRRMAAGAES